MNSTKPAGSYLGKIISRGSEIISIEEARLKTESQKMLADPLRQNGEEIAARAEYLGDLNEWRSGLCFSLRREYFLAPPLQSRQIESSVLQWGNCVMCLAGMVPEALHDSMTENIRNLSWYINNAPVENTHSIVEMAAKPAFRPVWLDFLISAVPAVLIEIATLAIT